VITDVGLVGGGSAPKPGEISLAHRGVLFLDEFPEYRRTALEALRAPLENGRVQIVRANGRVEFPARFQLIAAMNPCPCGRLGASGVSCLCSLNSIQGYLKKLSQPVLDRIDLHVELDPVPLSVLVGEEETINQSGDLREQIVVARLKQLERQRRLNSELSGDEIKKIAKLDDQSKRLLEKAGEKMGISARGFMRVLKVSRTIADLADSNDVGIEHIAEALSFRAIERLTQYAQGAAVNG
jgi:magnesium chelatase family protein